MLNEKGKEFLKRGLKNIHPNLSLDISYNPIGYIKTWIFTSTIAFVKAALPTKHWKGRLTDEGAVDIVAEVRRNRVVVV